MQHLDLAARGANDRARLKAATMAIASIIGIASISDKNIKLRDSWIRFAETGINASAETSVLRKAFTIASTFMMHSTSNINEQGSVVPLNVSELLQAIELLIHSAYDQNERNKPLPLRRAIRRTYMIGIAAAAGLAGLVYGVWMIYSWVSPEGVVITYFNGTSFDHSAARRVCHQLSLDYGTDRPAWGVRRNGWSARWEGSLVAPTEDEYEFYIQSMDGARLFIDNQCLIDNWHEQEWQASGRHANIRLNKGSHRFMLEHYNATGPSAIRVRWMGGGLPANSIIETPYLRKK